jgi:streptogramin lyase
MPSVKFLLSISVTIGIIVIVGVAFSISSRPGFPTGNNEKPNTTIHQVFLNNSTNIDTPFVKEFSMPNGTWPNAILVARNGIVWTVGTKSHTLIGFDPKQQSGS